MRRRAGLERSSVRTPRALHEAPVDLDGLHPRSCESYTIPYAIGARIELDSMGRPCHLVWSTQQPHVCSTNTLAYEPGDADEWRACCDTRESVIVPEDGCEVTGSVS